MSSVSSWSSAINCSNLVRSSSDKPTASSLGRVTTPRVSDSKYLVVLICQIWCPSISQLASPNLTFCLILPLTATIQCKSSPCSTCRLIYSRIKDGENKPDSNSE